MEFIKTPGLRKSKAYAARELPLYLMLVPGLFLLILFRYIPMGGLVIAFKDYNIFAGILASKWVGLDNFRTLFESSDFYKILWNTVIISFYRLVFGFPAPIILALLLNEVKNVHFKRISQNILYLPHFLSWVIISGLCFEVLSQNGIINNLIKMLGAESVFFLGDPRYFRGVLVGSAIWKEAGWGTIIYLAALTSIDQNLYEAAKIDGAGKLKQLIYVTLPGIVQVIIVLFILNLGSILDAGQDQILMMYNALVINVSDIIDTYVYRIGLGQARYSFTTAVGMFKSVVGLIFVLSSNFAVKKAGGDGLW